MKKNKLKAFLLAICVALPTMFALTACGHKHSFSEDWTSDATNHWHVCTDEDCDETSDSAEHTFVAKKDGTNHWSECSVCGYKKDEAAHNYATTKYDATKHWKECSCGDKKDEEAHTLTNTDLKTYTHNMGCTGCAYVAGEQNHTYEGDDDVDCEVCGQETRETATLAFKAGTTGTYELTYDGNAHAFDKTTLVEVDEATIDEVVVEYSVSGAATPVWTTEAPKNANTYNIRISVPATKDHTSAVATKEFKINQIEIDLTNFSRVYSLDEANRNGGLTEKVTSANFSVIVSSEEVPLRIVKNQEVSITEGTTYELKWYTETQDGSTGDAFAVLGLGDNSNYKIKTGTKGKIYITNSLTVDTEDSTKYTASATIQKDGYAYYSLKMDRTSKNINFDITLSNSNVEIVDVYSKVSWLTAKIAADGTLVTNGTVTGTGTIFIVVKYNGDEASITNTLTLTQNTATTTVANTSSLTSAINLENVDQYHATLKEDGTVIEENKVDKKVAEYYKKNNNDEVIYAGNSTSIYQYSKTTSATVWTRTLNSYETADAAKTAMYNATKFSSALLAGLTDVDELTFSKEEQMYKLASKEIGSETYTDVALKFENGKLVYAEYKKGDKTYSITFEYGDPDIDVPVANYLGFNKDNAIKVPYVRTDGTFQASNILLTEGNATYLKFTITADIIKSYANATATQCGVQGTFTVTGASGATITIEAFPYDDTSSLNLNSKKSENGKLLLTALKAGDYYLKITTTATCTGSLNMEKYAMTVTS